MKTAISIPDDLFRRADDLARQSGKSRSQLYREALAEYVDRHDPQAVTSAINQVVDELGPEDHRWLEAAGRGALERSEW